MESVFEVLTVCITVTVVVILTLVARLSCLSREYQIPTMPDVKGLSVGRASKYLCTSSSMGRYKEYLLSVCEVQPSSRYNWNWHEYAQNSSIYTIKDKMKL